MIDSTLKPAAHIANCAKKANQMLMMIQKTITYKNKEILLCIRVWLDHIWNIGHIRLIEGVQQRFTRMIPELKSLPYEARLKRLNLTTLEIRRIRGDLIEIYTIFFHLDSRNREASQIFTLGMQTIYIPFERGCQDLSNDT